MVVGTGGNKIIHEKQSNVDMKESAGFSADAKNTRRKKCGCVKVGFYLFLVLAFIFLVSSSSYLFYQNSKLEKQLKKCNEMENNIEFNREKHVLPNGTSNQQKSHVSATRVQLHLQSFDWHSIAKKLKKCVRTKTGSNLRPIRINPFCIRAAISRINKNSRKWKLKKSQ